MKNKTLLLMIFYTFLCCRPAGAQPQTKADSLLQVFNKEKTDTAKVSTQALLIKEYLKTGQMSAAKEMLKQMLVLADKTNNNLYKALARNYGSNIYANDRNLDSTLFYVNKTLSLLGNDKSKRATHIRITTNNSLAVAYSTAGKMEESVAIHIANLKLTQEIQDEELHHLSIHNIAASFVMMNQDDKAYEYMLQDVALADKPGSSPRLQVLAYLNATVVCYNLQKFSEQKKYLQKSFAALTRFGSNNLWAQYYAYEAMYYSGIKQPANALTAANKALAESRKYEDRNNEYLAYEALRDAESSMKHYDKARSAARKIYEMGMEDDYIEAAIDAVKNMSEFSAALNDYKAAYQYLEQYDRLKDSVQLDQNTQKINELEARLHTTQKEEEVTRLELEQKKTILKIKNQQFTNVLLAATCLLLAIILGLGYLFFRNNKRISRQKEKTKITEAMYSTQEEERGRIARDLHDGLGGALAGIKISLLSLTEDIGDARLKTELNKLSEQLGSAIEELRSITHNMTPSMLETRGLQASLQDLCQLLSASVIQVHDVFIDIADNIPMQKQIIIYRIVQEVFANILKHGAANDVFFQCSQQGHTFFITIEDNGKGFDSGRQYSGIGLKNIRNRVHFLNGSIDVLSRPEEGGTSINIQLDVR